MNTTAKWAIGIGLGVPAALILIGIIGLLIKFFVKRFRRRAWDEIRSLPKPTNAFDNSNNRKAQKDGLSECEPLVPPPSPPVPETTSISIRVADDVSHVIVPINESAIPSEHHNQNTNVSNQGYSIVQIQRDHLARLKEEEDRTRPMLRLSTDTLNIQKVIDEAQKDFDESVVSASKKIKACR